MLKFNSIFNKINSKLSKTSCPKEEIRCKILYSIKSALDATLLVEEKAKEIREELSRLEDIHLK